MKDQPEQQPLLHAEVGVHHVGIQQDKDAEAEGHPEPLAAGGSRPSLHPGGGGFEGRVGRAKQQER